MNVRDPRRPFPRLFVFLGAGGVGKTTLSAGFALSLAYSGRKVGLLSIDPAKRLQSALGAGVLPEAGKVIALEGGVPGGELRAALLHINESLRRWVIEQGLEPEAEAKLFKNALFRAVADRLATATDTFAAVRVAEWVEQYPDVEDLVIDTAPGIHAIDFLAKPERLSAFLDSKLVEWLKWFVGDKEQKSNVWQRIVKSGAKRILDGLAQIGGQTFLVNFGEFLVLLDQVFLTMVRRLDFAKIWIKDPATSFVLVTSVRDDAATVAKELGRVLLEMRLKAKLVVVNRSFPEELVAEVRLINELGSFGGGNDEVFFGNFLKSFALTQDRVKTDLAMYAQQVACLPVVSQLDRSQTLRMADLAHLGDLLRGRAELT